MTKKFTVEFKRFIELEIRKIKELKVMNRTDHGNTKKLGKAYYRAIAFKRIAG